VTPQFVRARARAPLAITPTDQAGAIAWRQCAPLLLVAFATPVYAYAIGSDSLGASEAYSALAAAQSSVASVVRTALLLDPGKPVLYHLLLHWFCGLFGPGEASLRGLSVLFALASIWLVFALGQELFGFETGMAAALIWAFNPYALAFAGWARMYTMLIAFALAHVLALVKLRERRTFGKVALGGILGAAMLYTHFGAMLIVGADLIVIVREFRREGRSATWPAVAVSIGLFAPFVPTAFAQTRSLLFGHWLDWIGVQHGSMSLKLLTGSVALFTSVYLALGQRELAERSEWLRRCLIYAAIPFVALAAASILVRPVFSIRYVSPSIAFGALVLAYGLNRMGERTLRLATIGLSALFLLLTPLYHRGSQQPWRKLAATISSSSNPGETIFFESGFFSSDQGVSPEEDSGFSSGFFRVPFDYYFHGPNPRQTVPGSDPDKARQLIAGEANRVGGAWLISGESASQARAELPLSKSFQIDFARQFSRVQVFHIRRVVPDR